MASRSGAQQPKTRFKTLLQNSNRQLAFDDGV
jgi:hypothetical protein